MRWTKNFPAPIPLRLERNYTYTRIITFDLLHCLSIFHMFACSYATPMHWNATNAERGRERDDFIISQGDKIWSVICLDPAAITDIIFAPVGIAIESVTLVITLTKPRPYSWPRWSTRRQIKGLKRSTRHSLMNYFESEIRLAPRSKRGVIALHPIINI